MLNFSQAQSHQELKKEIPKIGLFNTHALLGRNYSKWIKFSSKDKTLCQFLAEKWLLCFGKISYFYGIIEPHSTMCLKRAYLQFAINMSLDELEGNELRLVALFFALNFVAFHGATLHINWVRLDHLVPLSFSLP